MTKSTPGPWRVGDNSCTVFGPKTDAPAPKVIVGVTGSPFPSEEKRANARLIAAAPEMLTMLKEIMSINMDGQVYFDHDSEFGQKIRNLLNKAEGKS